MQKKLNQYVKLNLKQNSDGFQSIDIYHDEFEIDPFLVFTEFFMDRPIFPPHPHAGISVMTYMLPKSEGSFLNRDSLGDKSTIEPGGIHVTQAGMGIKHEEVPTITGQVCHGFQIWINHKDKDRLVKPKSFHAFSKEVPEFQNEKYSVRIVQGKFENLDSPIHLVTETTILDITLNPNSKIDLSSDEMAFIYLIDGKILIEGKEIDSKSIIIFEQKGNEIQIESNEKANFIFVSGKPINESIVQSGPFVMTHSEQMLETKLRLKNGEMGVL